jgi:two-component system chemotaxis response regulator CheY
MTLRESLRILVVDDRAVSRALVSQALDEIGILHHTTEGDGRTALGMLAARPVHLVIADLGMPGMNGLELLHSLRENRSTRDIGFILMTETPTPQVMAQGRHLGLNQLVRKPFSTATLRAAIERVVGRL